MSNKGFYTVAVYLVDRAYGGPEEGGWWYDCGQLVDDAAFAKPKIFDNEDEAIDYARERNLDLDETVNKGRREISSVLSNGRYCAMVCDGYPEPYYPERKPHYE